MVQWEFPLQKTPGCGVWNDSTSGELQMYGHCMPKDGQSRSSWTRSLQVLLCIVLDICRRTLLDLSVHYSWLVHQTPRHDLVDDLDQEWWGPSDRMQERAIHNIEMSSQVRRSQRRESHVFDAGRAQALPGVSCRLQFLQNGDVSTKPSVQVFIMTCTHMDPRSILFLKHKILLHEINR